MRGRSWIFKTLAGLGICILLAFGYHRYQRYQRQHLVQILKRVQDEQLAEAPGLFSSVWEEPEMTLTVVAFGHDLKEDEVWTARLGELLNEDLERAPSKPETTTERSGLVEVDLEHDERRRWVKWGTSSHVTLGSDWKGGHVLDSALICAGIDFGRVLVFDPQERWALVDSRLGSTPPPWPGAEARASTQARLEFEGRMVELIAGLDHPQLDWAWTRDVQEWLDEETLLLGLSGIELGIYTREEGAPRQKRPGTLMFFYDKDLTPALYSNANVSPELMEWIEMLTVMAAAEPAWVPSTSLGMKRPEGYVERGRFLPLSFRETYADREHENPCMPLLIGPLEDREAFLATLSELGLLTPMGEGIAHLHVQDG